MTDKNTNSSNQTSLRDYLVSYWRGDLLALLLLLLATLLFFWPVVAGKAWIPRGGGDSVSFIYPMYRFAVQSLWSGTIPLWNPYLYAGTSFIGDNQSGIFYPFNLMLFLLSPNFSYRAIEGLVIWHIFFAGGAMYTCLRLLRSPKPIWRPAALVGSLAFMFSGVFIAHIGNLNLIAVAAWLPLIFLALHRAISAHQAKTSVVWAIIGGVALGFSTLAGHGQMTFLLASFIAAYALFRSVSDRQLSPLLLLGIVGLTAVAVAAINLFPSFEAIRYTVRAGFGVDQATSYALPWRGLLGLLAPDFFGRGEGNFWGNWARVEYGYCGVLTLFLAGLAIVSNRSRLTLFFALSALLFLLLALGPHTFLYPLLLRWLPFFPFQVPARFMILVDFALAALAALGMDNFDRRPRTFSPYMIGSALVAGVLFALLLRQYKSNVSLVPHHQQQMQQAMAIFVAFAAASWLLILAKGKNWISLNKFGALAVLLLAADLIFLGRLVEIEWNDPMPGFAAGSKALEYIKSDPGLPRIDIATGAWQPNLPQIEQLYSIRGVYNPLELANYAAYIGSVGYRGSVLYNLLGTKYVVGGKNSPPADTTIIVPVFDDDPHVIVYLNTLALPRFNIVYNTSIVANHDLAFEAIHADNFDPLQTVILENGEPLQQEPGESEITILRYDPNRVAFEVRTDRPAYFLLSDIYHPHWQATVDGVATPILLADYALRAVALEPGIHIIEMWYSPPGWTVGLVISFSTLLFLLILLLIWLWRRQKVATQR
jgi:hypothetical protein